MTKKLAFCCSFKKKFKGASKSENTPLLSLDTVERYDPEENSWSMVASMTKVRTLWRTICP